MGPYTYEALKSLIVRGAISGDELIAQHPGGEWVSFAAIPEIYDLLLESFEGGEKDISSVGSAAEKMDANTVIVTKAQPGAAAPPPPNPADEVTRVADNSQFADFTKTIITGFSNLSRGLRQIVGEEPNEAQALKPKKIFDKSKFVPVDTSIPTMTTNGAAGERATIELPSINVRLFRFSMFAVLLVGLGFWVNEEFSDQASFNHGGKLHLLIPSEKAGSFTEEEAKATFLKVKAAFERGNTSDWLQAQDLLIKLAEADPVNTDYREKLCLVHKQLWPFAYQDAEDLQVLTHMAQTTRSLNQGAPHGRTCEVVRSWLTGGFQEAKSQLELLIQEFPNIPFYIWLKTEMLISEGDFINGQGFASSLVALWPEFNEAKVLAVQAHIGNGRFQNAREVLVEILEKYPLHKVAKLMLGEIEFRHFQHEEQAWELLITGVKSEELVPRSIDILAYTTLAQISEKRGDLGSARKFAEKGFELNPTNEGLRAMVKKYGGSDRNFNEMARTQELVAMGDQYVRAGDCLAAQAQYRAAFDLNPKHPVAAVKAARCLYKINQVFRSFEYLKSAIKSNPEYFPAYTLLADYYSEKYDFESAMGVLNQARSFSTEAYEIYKGYALVELRKNNFGGSLGYIKRAITIYSTDPEAYVIMSKAHLIGGQPKEALQAAQKAIDIDSLHVEAKIAYGKAQGALMGENSGIEYFKKMVAENKFVVEYKLGLAEELRKLERYAEALLVYEEIVAAEPKNKKARMGMGDALNGIGKVEAARTAYLLAATFDPTDPEPVIRAGLLYLDAGSSDLAIEQFERALAINKNYPKAYFYIGKAAFLKGEFQKALDAALAERRANPNLVDSYLLAAEVYMVTRKFSLCTTEFQQAIKIGAQGADNYVKLARCYRLSGSYDVAQSMLDIAAEKESGYAEAYKERGALYQVQGDKEAAYRSYEKYLALSPNAPDKNDIEALMSQLSVR